MPLYDFSCHACGARFEQRTPTGVLPHCPDCGSEETERLPSPFAGPFTVAPRGVAARRSDASRRAREEQRLERKEERRRQRAERSKAPGEKRGNASES